MHIQRFLLKHFVACCIACVLGQSSLTSAQSIDAFEDLTLTTLDGRRIGLGKSDSITVLAFLGNECPVARAYAQRLEEMAKQFSESGVRFVGINSNQHDSKSEMGQLVSDLSLRFPLAKDADQTIAKRFQATRTAEVVVLDRNSTIVYRGRIDDQFSPGVKRAAPSRLDLQIAIEELLANKPVSIPSTPPVGCLITFLQAPAQKTDFTYCKTIAPILYANCLECHRTGEIGPFDISNYDEVLGWADMLVEVIEQKRMPPWHANPEHSSFKNARQMPLKSLETIKEWVAGGMPYGDAEDLPSKPTFLDGWRLPKKPDQVVMMREQPYRVPAVGSVDYQYFVVDPGVHEDRWITAAQVIPGSPEVVHHAIVFIRPPDGESFTGIGWLTAYVPGQRATEFPSGYARRVPAGSKLVFQMHYTPNGKEQLDQTKIGLNFTEESSVTHEVFTLAGIDQEFEIPPNTAKHAVDASVGWLPKDGILLAAMPHMHLRGKAFQVRIRQGDVEQTVLDVPHYDFNWQHTYEWSEPILLQDIDRLSFTATFDNSPKNPFNPNPNEYVMWGDQTWEEMAVAFFEVARPRTPGGTDTTGRVTTTAKAATSNKATESDDLKEAKDARFADDFLARFDGNRDGVVSRSEVSRIVRDYSFRIMDLNNDGKLTREELMDSSRSRRGR